METLERLDIACLSLTERDYRWGRVRAAMKQEGIDCLVLQYNTGHWGQFQADMQYITHLGAFEGELAAVFPLEGEVTAWCAAELYAPFWRACQTWVPDVRGCSQRWSEAILARLRELGMEAAHIGIPGLASSIHAREGFVDYHLVHTLKEQLPRATISNATPLMQRLRSVKSEEEVDAMRRATALAELAVTAGAAVAKPGVPDVHVYAEIVATILRNGGWTPTVIFWRAGPEIWMNYHYPTNRPLQSGDIVSSEIEGQYLGYRGQIYQPIGVEYFKSPYKEMLDASIGAFNHTAPLMKPGVPYRQLKEEFDRYAKESPYEVQFILQARGLGEDWPIVLGAAGPEVLDAHLEENNTLVIKHKALTQTPPRAIIWGDMVVVKPEGGVRLGTRPQAPIIARA
jgi:Xaa-Pro dipeptidase